MSDQLTVLKLVTSRLDSAGIAYMVTGSMAAGHYGQPRMTRDIDLVAVLAQSQAERLEEWLGPEFVCDPDAARAAIAARRTFNVFHRRAPQKVQSGLDWPYLDRWAIRLTVAKLLKEVRA